LLRLGFASSTALVRLTVTLEVASLLPSIKDLAMTCCVGVLPAGQLQSGGPWQHQQQQLAG
jgi:hypothetical protein